MFVANLDTWLTFDAVINRIPKQKSLKLKKSALHSRAVSLDLIDSPDQEHQAVHFLLRIF